MNRPVAPVQTDLGGGVWSFQTPLWQTNSLLAVANGEALLCDPALTAAELDAIGAEVRRRAGEARYLLVTHADYDHVCGIPSLPEAEVVAGLETGVRLRDGTAASGLASGGAEWGIDTSMRSRRRVLPRPTSRSTTSTAGTRDAHSPTPGSTDEPMRVVAPGSLAILRAPAKRRMALSSVAHVLCQYAGSLRPCPARFSPANHARISRSDH